MVFSLPRFIDCINHCDSNNLNILDWDYVYIFSKDQSIHAILLYEISRIYDSDGCPESFEYNKAHGTENLPEDLYYQWASEALAIQEKNLKMNKQCVELQMKLSEFGIRSSILKGQGIARYYKCDGEDLSLYRQCGDIDVYVDCGREKALDFAHGIGQEDVEWDYKHLHLKMFGDTSVEVHYRAQVLLNPFKNHRLQTYFKLHESELLGEPITLSDGSVITAPVGWFNVFYIILHLYHHLFGEGIGLRQLMDLYFVLENTALDDEGIGKLKAAVHQFGMGKFASALMWALPEALGEMSGAPLWEPDPVEGKFLLEDVMRGGNFGQADERFNMKGKNRAGRLGVIIRRNMHLLVHYPGDALAAPLYYIWHFFWKRIVK